MHETIKNLLNIEEKVKQKYNSKKAEHNRSINF